MCRGVNFKRNIFIRHICLVCVFVLRHLILNVHPELAVTIKHNTQRDDDDGQCGLNAEDPRLCGSLKIPCTLLWGLQHQTREGRGKLHVSSFFEFFNE